MIAEQRFKEGDLEGALSALQDDIRKTPQDASLRIFLFQLLCIMGAWQRAVQQLKTCATLDPQANAMAQMYRTAIICELYRNEVFQGTKQPLIFGEPEDWIASMIEALKYEASGNMAAAADLRAHAFEVAPAIGGQLDGQPFGWIADADPRLGPILEVIVNGRYFWAPFSVMRQVHIEAPSDLRDRVWMPATITWSNGGDAVGLIPTRYVGTTGSKDNQLLLSASTSWQEGNGNLTASGLGQRLFATDQSDFALMDVRELVLDETADRTSPPERSGGDHG
ncbi:type VI secretion system accessory protein TagJ [Cohaesibacter marisflavi]|uniref:type VI secretion system accessory protein TagJ n=1 Tax=Cohaesibacter marisflavi TaxID=655353 RepID=UPI0029C66B1A|nr:type VI secretion system accessory protein TagJ [Cohaesibacter marisflavi]